MADSANPPTWRAFLNNHVKDLVAIDFFTVPTAGFKVLFVLVILAQHRRRVIHFNMTEHPTAQWIAQQLNEAFPWESARATCFGIAMPFMGMRFKDASTAWA